MKYPIVRFIQVIALVLICFYSNYTQAQVIAAGHRHSLFMCADQTIWASGQNSFGQLGNGTMEDTVLAVQVFLPSNIIAISAGRIHSLALTDDGKVWAWEKVMRAGLILSLVFLTMVCDRLVSVDRSIILNLNCHGKV